MGPQETGQTQGGWNLPITYCKGIRINTGLCTMAIYGVSRLEKLGIFLCKNECVADSATSLVAHNLGASQAQMGPQETGQFQGGWNLPALTKNSLTLLTPGWVGIHERTINHLLN